MNTIASKRRLNKARDRNVPPAEDWFYKVAEEVLVYLKKA